MNFRFWIALYKEGFSHLGVGKTLWKVIFIKLLVMLVLFKGLFFNETLHTLFDDETQKSEYVLDNLTKDIK